MQTVTKRVKYFLAVCGTKDSFYREYPEVFRKRKVCETSTLSTLRVHFNAAGFSCIHRKLALVIEFLKNHSNQ